MSPRSKAYLFAFLAGLCLSRSISLVIEADRLERPKGPVRLLVPAELLEDGPPLQPVQAIDPNALHVFRDNPDRPGWCEVCERVERNASHFRKVPGASS